MTTVNLTIDDFCLVTDFVANGSFASLKSNVRYLRAPAYAILVRLTDSTKKWLGDFVYVDESAFNFLRKSTLYPGDIIISNVGDPGIVFMVPDLGKPMTLGPNSILVRPDNAKADRNFLAHYLSSAEGQTAMEKITSSTAQRKFNKTSFRKIVVPLPSLAEQRRIAAILDKADALRGKRREAIAKLDQLLQSVFLEMFGDPVTNPKCEVVELASLCERVTDGTHQSPKWSQSGVPFLFQSNVKPGEISFDTKKSISVEDYNALTARCSIEYGDVLYTIVGSYGNAAMVRTHQKFCFQRHIAHLKPKDHVLPEFLEGMMNHPSVKRQADERVTGIAQKTLILKELKRLLVVNPSMAQQIQFRKVSQRIFESRKTMLTSEAKFSDQFESIQSAAFAGTL